LTSFCKEHRTAAAQANLFVKDNKYFTGKKDKLLLVAMFSFSLGQYTTVFEATVYAIKACADENIKRGYRNRNIYILSDSQVAIKALDYCKIYSRHLGLPSIPYDTGCMQGSTFDVGSGT
jgi:hypothetical protein